MATHAKPIQNINSKYVVQFVDGIILKTSKHSSVHFDIIYDWWYRKEHDGARVDNLHF